MVQIPLAPPPARRRTLSTSPVEQRGSLETSFAGCPSGNQHALDPLMSTTVTNISATLAIVSSPIITPYVEPALLNLMYGMRRLMSTSALALSSSLDV